MHKDSASSYDYIAKWLSPNFFYSTNQNWERMGVLGVLGDIILTNLSGDIFEIGVGESSIYLTALSKKFGRRIFHCDIEDSKIINPLTVPGYLSEDHIYIDRSSQESSGIGYRCVLFAGSSDDMFKKVKITPLALVFIDGGHMYEQVKKDFDNVIPLLVDDGVIILHDTYPPSEDYIHENGCGTVYKLRQEIEKNKEFDCFTFTRGIGMGVGLTIIRKRKQNGVYYQ